MSATAETRQLEMIKLNGRGAHVMMWLYFATLTVLAIWSLNEVRTAWPTRVEQAIGDAQVFDVNDGAAQVAGRCEQFGDFLQRGVQPRQLQHAAAVLLLRIDNQQGRIAQAGGGMAAACEGEERLWGGHGSNSRQTDSGHCPPVRRCCEPLRCSLCR